MAESSIFWTTGSTGDGASEYTQAELIRWLRQTFIGDNTDEGVLKNYENELEVTDGGGADVDINTGGAYVYGFPYWNTASVTKTLDTPSSDPRIDRIVLEADWTAQTVRITVVKGSEAASPTAPSLTQTDGTTWQISLAQVQIGTDGDIDSVTDERVFIHPNIEIIADMMDSVVAHASDHERAGSDEVDGDHLDIDWDPSNYTPATTPAEAANADDLAAHLYGIDQEFAEMRDVFYPSEGGNTLGHFEVKTLATSGGTGTVEGFVPGDFNSISSMVAIVRASTGVGSHNFDIDLSSQYGAAGEDYNNHAETDTASTYSITDDQWAEVDISGVFSSLAAGDYFAIELENNDGIYALSLLGVRLNYT